MRGARILVLLVAVLLLKSFFVASMALGYYKPSTLLYVALQPVVLLLAASGIVLYSRGVFEPAKWVAFTAVTLDLLSYLVEFGPHVSGGA